MGRIDDVESAWLVNLQLDIAVSPVSGCSKDFGGQLCTCSNCCMLARISVTISMHAITGTIHVLLNSFITLWVWLSSPNLMPEARAHVSKVGVATGYTHTLLASANYIPNTHTGRTQP